MPHYTEGFGQEIVAGARGRLRSEPLFLEKGKTGLLRPFRTS